MKGKLVLVLALCLLLAAAIPALAQVSAHYDLSWHVIGGGGGESTSAAHLLRGTVGQALTGTSLSSSHMLCSGFWCSGAAVVSYHIYLPLVLRGA